MSSSPHPTVALPPNISRGYQYVAMTWSLVSVAVIVVILRFCIRGLLRRRIGGDDYTILAALTCALVQSSYAIHLVQEGLGRNIQYVQPVQIKILTREIFITILFNIAGTALVRISVCLFILQLLPFTEKISRWFVYGLAVTFASIALATFLSLCFRCIPIQGLWDPSINARCISPALMTRINEASGALTVIMDVICVLLPILIFRKLQIGWREKLAVFALLGLSLLTAGAAVARTLQYKFVSNNPTWELIPDAIWASVEQNIGIIVASVPALRQFFTIFRKRQNSQRSQSSEKPFGIGNKIARSPPTPSTEDMENGHIPSHGSPTSSAAAGPEMSLGADCSNKPSPAFSLASRLRQMSWTAEKQQGAQHPKNAERKNNKEWESRRESRPTLGNPSVSGYSCEIVGGSP